MLNHPRREHGYCVDDVARGLGRDQPAADPTDDVVALSRVYAEFVVRAIDRRGWVHNRRGETDPGQTQ